MLTSFMAFVVRYLVLGLAAAAVFVADLQPLRTPTTRRRPLLALSR